MLAQGRFNSIAGMVGDDENEPTKNASQINNSSTTKSSSI